jgi:RNA polymerase sigma factor (TIGR02999 family)
MTTTGNARRSSWLSPSATAAATPPQAGNGGAVPHDVVSTSRGEITQLLQAHARGDADALDRLLPNVYEQLRRIARARLRRERMDHTLSTTDVVHEAFLDLMPLDGVSWRDRAHFFALASRAMRNVLVDHAVRRGAAKRGGGARAVTLDEALAGDARPFDDLVAVGEALDRLERLDPRQARVVECRFFGGLSLDETAAALGISAATVSRDWTFARAWLHRELAADHQPRTGARQAAEAAD